MMIGGKLGIEGASTDSEVLGLIDAGFNAVFTSDANPDDLPNALTRIPSARRELCEARHGG
jgi:hypothetical protein